MTCGLLGQLTSRVAAGLQRGTGIGGGCPGQPARRGQHDLLGQLFVREPETPPEPPRPGRHRRRRLSSALRRVIGLPVAPASRTALPPAALPPAALPPAALPAAALFTALPPAALPPAAPVAGSAA